jgi:hypothetical protein
MDQNVMFRLDLVADAAELLILGAILWMLHRLWSVNSTMLRVLRRISIRDTRKEIGAALDQSLLGR